MSEMLALRLGEERAVHLPPGEWSVTVDEMESAVSVRKLWAADPYPDDGDDDDAPRPAPDVVFMVRALAPGHATLRFSEQGRTRDIDVTVRM
jgi:hypothetical protein